MKPKTRNAVLLTLLILVIAGCSYNDNETEKIVVVTKTPGLIRTEYGGCFNEQKSNNSTFSSDTLYYQEINDTLVLHVIINRNCASSPADSVVIDRDHVNIYIKDTYPPSANCMCDFEFNYYFTDYNALEDFNVYYKYYDATDYALWDSLVYP